MHHAPAPSHSSLLTHSRPARGDSRAGASSVACALIGLATATASAQIATFDSTTDSITFAPACISVPNRITYEAMLRIDADQAASNGSIYEEIRPFSYDRQLGFTATSVYEYTHPIDAGALWQAPAVITPGVWHHLAYCYDGSEQRFYLDGALIASRQRTGNIATGCIGFPSDGAGAIGRSVRGDGSIFASFRGSLEWLRISSTARYTGPSFAPPTTDPASDPDTMLLYTFDECDGVSIALDSGPMGRNGTIGGSGGQGSSRPAFSRVCCPADLDDDGNFDNGATRDGATTIDDFLYFLAAFEAGSQSVDLDDDAIEPQNPDGGVDINDLLFFLARFEAGC